MEPEESSNLSVYIFAAVLLLYFIFVIFPESISLLIRLLPGSFQARFLPRLSSEYMPFLIHNFPFYNKLDDHQRRIFEGRMQKFIKKKEFIPRGGYKEVTVEMKALIAGSAIQLTFGYPNIYFRHFDKILIYPDDYYSIITRKYHKGEVNRGGIIVLSWTNLKDSFSNHFDGIHLGLHEMAHALRLINIVENEEYDFYDRELMSRFDTEALKEIEKIKAGNTPSIFRNYSTTNNEEFFAIAVEVFFEQADQFYQYNPSLFAMLSKILKIDPRSSNDLLISINTQYDTQRRILHAGGTEGGTQGL